MSAKEVVIAKHNIVTSYGWGVDALWTGLLSGSSAVKPLERFKAKHFLADKAATIEGLDASKDESLVMQMLTGLFEKEDKELFKNALPILATTTGEVDLLEKYVLKGFPNKKESLLDRLLARVTVLAGSGEKGFVVSAACSSASVAIAQAAGMISNGERDSVLVVACDAISEFVFAGFSTIMALDKDIARPFDKNRNGLTIGEAAGYMLLMSREVAEKENLAVLAKVSGWGMSSDANHITGPSKDGSGLAFAVNKAIDASGLNPQDIGSISAHGTGTLYNDSMEIKAFKRVFDEKVPVYSVKGGTGHTMAAAGLVEASVAVKSLNEGVVPGTVNLETVDPEASGWVKDTSSFSEKKAVLSTNSGFGGINAALVLCGDKG